jgi:hypothetical protein
LGKAPKGRFVIFYSTLFHKKTLRHIVAEGGSIRKDEVNPFNILLGVGFVNQPCWLMQAAANKHMQANAYSAFF